MWFARIGAVCVLVTTLIQIDPASHGDQRLA
jgi:hypothetical protein